jgi:cell division protein FtsN
LLFLAGYTLDIFARKGSSKNLMFFSDKGRSSKNLSGIKLEKVSPESYLSFFETLTNTGQKNEQIDSQREKELLEIKRTVRKPADEADKEAEEKIANPDRQGVIYQIQLGSFNKYETARSFAEQLAEKGYAPYITAVPAQGKGTAYRVRIGRYNDLEKAQKMVEELQEKEKIVSFITSK